MYRNMDVLKILNQGLIFTRAPSKFIKGGQYIFDKAVDRYYVSSVSFPFPLNVIGGGDTGNKISPIVRHLMMKICSQ